MEKDGEITLLAQRRGCQVAVEVAKDGVVMEKGVIYLPQGLTASSNS